MPQLKDAKITSELSQNFELGDLHRMVRAYTREAIEGYVTPDTAQNIVLPPQIYEPSKSFVRVPQESRGVMLASISESAGKQYWLVEYMQTLGYGDSTSVFPREEKRQAFIKMMGTHGKDMKTIEYHSHTTSTGTPWFDKFSGGDFQTIQRVLNSDPNYAHALFTPTHLLTLAAKETSIKLARGSKESNQAVIEKFQKWQELFKSFMPQTTL